MIMRKIAAASALGLSMGLALLGAGTAASAHSAWSGGPVLNTAQDGITVINSGWGGCGWGGCGGWGGWGGWGGGDSWGGWGGGWGN